LRRLTFAVRLGALLLFCVVDLLYRCEKWAGCCCCFAGSVGTTDAGDKGENADTAKQCHSLLCFGLSCNGNKGFIIAGSVYGHGEIIRQRYQTLDAEVITLVSFIENVPFFLNWVRPAETA